VEHESLHNRVVEANLRQQASIAAPHKYACCWTPASIAQQHNLNKTRNDLCMVRCLMAVAQAAELGLQARRRNYTGQDSDACQKITDAPTVTDELRRLEGEMSRLRRLVGICWIWWTSGAATRRSSRTPPAGR
jgi:hypothetical protein